MISPFLILAGAVFACPSPIVHDGDTFRCAGGHSLRLARVDAPELPGSPRCRRSRCPAARALAARQALVSLFGYQPIRCRVVDASPFIAGFQATDKYARPVVSCTNTAGDFAKQMIRTGHARPWP